MEGKSDEDKMRQATKGHAGCACAGKRDFVSRKARSNPCLMPISRATHMIIPGLNRHACMNKHVYLTLTTV